MNRRGFTRWLAMAPFTIAIEANAQIRVDRPDFHKLSEESQRELFRVDYEEFIQLAASRLNYIKARIDKSGKGYALMAVHTFFTRHSFEIGPLGPLVERWVTEYRLKLNLARIVRVGVSGTGDYRSSTWFGVRP